MKKIMLVAFTISMLAACAPKQDPPPPVWRMSWSCNGNSYCYYHMSPNAWSGSGAFENSATCLAWEYGFLNGPGYYGGSVTPCTESN